MKVCFIGACGHWSQAYACLKNRKNVVFVGFAPGSPEEDSNESIHITIPYFKSYKTMLEETKPDLAIVSPVFGITGRIVIECARRKIDVFSEKPIASSLEELDEVQRAIQENGIRFSAMHYLRFDPAFYQAAHMVQSGMIGQLKMITAQKSYKYGKRPGWYADPELYGGTIPWVGIHAIDWISYFSGKRFLSVHSCCVGENPEMAAICQFQLEDQVIASANIDYYRPDMASTHGDDRVRCVGTEGVVEVIAGKVTMINKEGSFEYSPTEAPELLSEFLEGKIPIPLEEIFHITRVAIAARESAKNQKTMNI